MPENLQLETLPPNDPQGHHRRRGERIERKTIEIGKGQYRRTVEPPRVTEPAPHSIRMSHSLSVQSVMRSRIASSS